MKVSNVYGIIFQLVKEGNTEDSEMNKIEELVEAYAGESGISFNTYRDNEKIVIVSIYPTIEDIGEKVFNSFNGEIQMSEKVVIFVLEEVPSEKASKFGGAVEYISSLGVELMKVGDKTIIMSS